LVCNTAIVNNWIGLRLSQIGGRLGRFTVPIVLKTKKARHFSGLRFPV
jgi:hypothetical protein